MKTHKIKIRKPLLVSDGYECLTIPKNYVLLAKVRCYGCGPRELSDFEVFSDDNLFTKSKLFIQVGCDHFIFLDE
jgi:hypothetical protein